MPPPLRFELLPEKVLFATVSVPSLSTPPPFFLGGDIVRHGGSIEGHRRTDIVEDTAATAIGSVALDLAIDNCGGGTVGVGDAATIAAVHPAVPNQHAEVAADDILLAFRLP